MTSGFAMIPAMNASTFAVPWIGRRAARFTPPPSVVSSTSGASTATISVSATVPCAASRNAAVSARWVSSSTGWRGARARTWARARLTSCRTEASERSSVSATSG